jgi:hypothetical protein
MAGRDLDLCEAVSDHVYLPDLYAHITGSDRDYEARFVSTKFMIASMV